MSVPSLERAMALLPETTAGLREIDGDAAQIRRLRGALWAYANPHNWQMTLDGDGSFAYRWVGDMAPWIKARLALGVGGEV